MIQFSLLPNNDAGVFTEASLPGALVRLRKLYAATGVKKDVVRHEFYVGPSARRRVKSIKARRRYRRIERIRAAREAARDQ